MARVPPFHLSYFARIMPFIFLGLSQAISFYHQIFINKEVSIKRTIRILVASTDFSQRNPSTDNFTEPSEGLSKGSKTKHVESRTKGAMILRYSGEKKSLGLSCIFLIGGALPSKSQPKKSRSSFSTL